MRKFLIHENLDQYIDFHIYSDEINCSKPEPTYFSGSENNLKDQDLPLSRFYTLVTIRLPIIKEQKTWVQRTFT